MENRQYDYQMPYGQYAYPNNPNTFPGPMGPTCPYCGKPLGGPFGGGFGGGFGPGPGPGPGPGGPFGGGQCPYGNNPWWR